MTDPIRRPAPAKPAPVKPAPVEDNRVEIIMPSQYADRRAEPRFNCDNRGALLLAEGRTVPCRILDQSASGARVSIAELDRLPAELWLIDLDSHTVRRGSAAWSMANRMGLKFNFVQKLAEGQPRPAKVPEDVFAAWLKLSGQDEPPRDDGDDVVYFD
jgi:hypothetical protein